MNNELIPHKKWLRWAGRLTEIKDEMVNDLLEDIPDGVYHFDGNVMMGSAIYDSVDVYIHNGVVSFKVGIFYGAYNLDDISINDTLHILSGMKRKED